MTRIDSTFVDKAKGVHADPQQDLKDALQRIGWFGETVLSVVDCGEFWAIQRTSYEPKP